MMAKFTTGIPTTVVLQFICFYTVIYGEDYDERQGRLLHTTDSKFQCESEGFHADPYDCSLFYRCIDWGESSENSLQSRFTSFKFQCGGGSVFDPDTNSCIHASDSSRSECQNELLQPLLFNIPRAEALQSTNDNTNGPDYGVVQSENYSPPPQQPSYGNKPGTDHQIEPVAEVDNTIGEPMPPRVTRSPPCSAEGFFPIENDCVHFYRCVSMGKGFSKYEFSCGDGTVWDPDNNACNYPWAVQRTDCKANGQGGNEEVNNQIEDNNPNMKPEQEQPENSNDNQDSKPISGSEQSASEKPNASNLENEPGTNNGESNNGQPPNSVGKNDCVSEGFHPVMNDCKKFIRCVNNGNGGYIRYEFECAEGTVWDIDSVTCNYPYAVQRSDCKTDSNGSAPDQNSPIIANQNQPSTSEPGQGTVAQSPYPTGQTSSTSSQQSSSTNNQQSSFTNQTSSTSSQQSSSSNSHQTSSSSSQNQTSNSGFNQVQGSTSSNNFQTTGSWQSSTSGQGSSSASNSQTTSGQQSSTSGSNQQGSTNSSNSHTMSSGQQSSGTTNAGNSQTTSTDYQGSNSGSTTGSNSQTTSSSSGLAQQGSSGQSSTSSSSQQGGQTSNTGSNQQGTTSGNYQGTSSGQSSTTNSNQQGSTIGSQTTSGGYGSGSSTDQQSNGNQQGSQSTTSSQQTTGNENVGNSSQTANQNKDDTCTAEGFFPSSKNCNKFYRCVKNGGSGYTKYEFNCGPGTVWDPDNKVCNHPSAVQSNCQSQSESTSSGPAIDSTTSPCTNNSSLQPSVSTTSAYATTKPVNNNQSSTTKPTTTVSTSTKPGLTSTSKPTSSMVPSKNETTTTRQPAGVVSSTKPPTSTSSGLTSSPATPNRNETTTSATLITDSTPPNLPTQGGNTNESNEGTTAVNESTTSQYNETTPSAATQGGSTNEPNEDTTVGANESTTSQYNETMPSGTTPTSENNTSTKPVGKFPCPKAGFYPHPDDCKKFYRCVDWDGDKGKRFSIFHFDCPDGTIFDPSLDTCNYESAVYPPRDCGNTNVSQTTDSSQNQTNSTQPSTNSTENPVTNVTNSSEITSSGDNTSTVTNENTTSATTEPYTDQTTPGTETSPVNGTLTTINSTPGSTDTVPEGNTGQTTQAVTSSSAVTPAELGSSGTTNTATTTTLEESSTAITTSSSTGAETTTISSTSPSETCPELGPDQFLLVCPTGFRRHPKYCNLFYQCTTSPNNEIKVLTLSCTNGTVYDDKKIQCLPPEQAKKCDGSMMDTRFLRQMNDNSSPPIPIKSDKTICPNEGTFSYKEDCRLFYKCKKDDEGRLNGYIYQCPEGFSYWNISKRCEKSEKVPCDGGRKSTPISKSSLAPVEMKNIGHK